MLLVYIESFTLYLLNADPKENKSKTESWRRKLDKVMRRNKKGNKKRKYMPHQYQCIILVENNSLDL